TLTALYKKLRPFVRPYNKLVILTLALTVVGSFAAQVNAYILRFTVDSISDLMVAKEPLSKGFSLLTVISSILLGKEVLNSVVQFGQKYYGERLRILI